MAVFNEILAGRFNRAVQKLFSMKGPPPTPQLASEIIPIHPFASGVENAYLEGWNRYGINLLVAAVAAQAGAIRWRNPSNSGVIAVFEKLMNINTVIDNPNWNINASTVDLTTVINAGLNITKFDSRGNQSPSIIVSSQTAASGLGGLAFAQCAFPANSFQDLIYTESQQITLLPGQALQNQSNIVNQNLIATAWWRERPLEDSEAK